ncbi:MAG: hypothetical protein JO035_06850 [Betaproteobacteria bacterium]|nr:hypothetical protein [Betaproteobacteria bacterium]
MRLGAGLFVFLLLLARPALCEEEAKSLDLAYKTRAIGESHAVRGDSPFAAGIPLTPFGADRGRVEEEVRGRAGPVSLLLTGTYATQERAASTGRLVANELYTDFGSGENHFTLGKKILSGDVGYGFRPIDVLQREVRLQVLPPVLVGVPHVAWERFTADEAWSAFWTNPGEGRRSDPKRDGSFALRYYRRAEIADLHGIARASDRFGLEAGGAFSSVPHESVELHGSFLQMRRGERTAPLAETAPTQQLLNPGLALQTQDLDHPRKALGGFTFTRESGWSFIGELWWDGTAPTADQWRQLGAEARRRSALAALPGIPSAAVAGSLAASSTMFGVPSISRRSALAHLGWTDPGGNGWSANLDYLRTLEDGGYNVTAQITWEADRLRLDAGVRRFGGRSDSAYRLLPERSILFAGIALAF